jgi:hypothetical protein
MLYRQSFYASINHISAVYVTGIAGQESLFSYTDGVKACCRNIRRQWYMNTAVLPVATFESQIEIVSKSVGKLSKGMEGMSTASRCLNLLEQDEDYSYTISDR